MEAVWQMGDDLSAYWERYRACFRTRTRDTSANAYLYWRGQLTMEDARNFANIERRLSRGDGQALQQFVTDSPWEAQAVFAQIQTDIRARPALQQGGVLILDESADEKAGHHSLGASRQYNGRLGKVDLCQVGVYLTYAHPASGVWALVDGELFLPEEWFTPALADRRQELGLPTERIFATKAELGWQLIQRAQGQGLPFDHVACDDLYGKSREFRAALDAAHLAYAADVPADTQVYLQAPKVGTPRKRHKKGPRPTRLKVLSRQVPHEVRTLAASHQTVWQQITIRHAERGELVADFAVRSVWTVTPTQQVRAEWLVMRRTPNQPVTFTLLNAPAATSAAVLIERSCQRHFTERNFQDGKSELGWADFQAQKYRAWQHHTALTAAATWFVAEVKLNWRERYARDPELLQQLEVEVLPALSTANVRDLLQAVLPVPQFTPQQARELVATHLVHRARSTASRLRTQHFHEDSG
jgi:SRSO17 transposase